MPEKLQGVNMLLKGVSQWGVNVDRDSVDCCVSINMCSKVFLTANDSNLSTPIPNGLADV